MAGNRMKPLDFCNVNLTKDDKAKFAKWRSHEDTDIDELLSVCISEGNKVSLGYNFEKHMYVCSVTCRTENHANENWCVTSRAGDCEQALAVALYKHFVLLDGAVYAEFAQDSDWG